MSLSSSDATLMLRDEPRAGRLSAGMRTGGKAAVDVAIAAVALQAAYLLGTRTGLLMLGVDALWVLGVCVLVKSSIAFAAGTYRPLWRYTSFNEVLVITTSSILASLALVILSVTQLIHAPVPVILIDAFLYPAGVVGVRAMRRVQILMMRRLSRGRMDVEVERAIVVGAGDSAHALLVELEHRHHGRWEIIGLLDDDPAKLGATVRGYRVLAPTTALESIIARSNIRHVVIAMPSADPALLRRLIARGRSSGASVLSVRPAEQLLLNGNSPTPVTVADLLDSAEISSTLRLRTRTNERPFTLVTGGAGYIGSHVVKRLLDDGHRVRVLDNFTYGSRGLDAVRHRAGLEIVDGDISSIRDIVSAVKDVDAVVALAAIVGDPACGLDAEETLNLNYESTKVLVEACSFYNVSRLVFASSCSVYGASDETFLSENAPLHPVSLYARTRILSEDVIFSRCGDVVPVVLRLSTVFGQSRRMRYDLVVNTLTARAVVDGRIEIHGGDQWRPFVHCKDAANAFRLALTAPEDAVSHQIFNVGSEELNYRISDIGNMVGAAVGNVDVANFDGMADRRNYRVSFAKIRSRLGFKPAYDLERGIAEMVTALRADTSLRDYNRLEYSNVKTLQERLTRVPAQRTGGIRLTSAH